MTNAPRSADVDACQAALYIHIPFCHHRCTYCDFNIYAGMRALYERYTRAVAQEIEAAPDGLSAPTIYFGGGTPSLLPAADIALILDAARARFHVPTHAEVTLEANPRADDDGYFDRLRALGVNRLSLGMQSAHDRDLHLFRRGHSFDDVARTARIARAAGFDNLNLDLIYGIPGQSLADWRATLDAALSLDPEHISAYGLQIEDGTTLKKWIAQGKMSAPNDDRAADMYALAEAALEQAGFAHYEISNWARAASTAVRQPIISKHNLTYWRNEPYLGFGCGAHSWFGGRRFANLRHPRAYVEAIAAGQGVEAQAEIIGRDLEMGETMMVGLRLLEEGVDLGRFAARFGVDPRQAYPRQIARLAMRRLIEIDARRVRLTPGGRLVGNQAFMAFLPG